jgi:hypothetical protein
VTPTTSKAIIESLVTNVVAKQLDMPSLMDDDIQEADEESDEEGSKEVDAADDWEQDNEEAANAEPMASQESKKSLCQPPSAGTYKAIENFNAYQITEARAP